METVQARGAVSMAEPPAAPAPVPVLERHGTVSIALRSQEALQPSLLHVVSKVIFPPLELM